MWQTIQVLLGPDEHSSFLTEAVQKWDVKDPTTGELFPKVLPRQCFPLEPDKHMVAWYEGVSERLRREAEDEERQQEIEAQQAEVRRLRAKREDTDDEGSVDSKGPALAYFRNPLYRHVDGRPSIVRRNSKRPALSPRQTVVDKGKGAATTVGHVFRNIGSPHLWDGGHHHAKSHSRDRDRKRRTSLPDNRYHPDGPPPPPGHDSALSPGQDRNHRRRRSGQLERPPTSSEDDEWRGDGTPGPSPRPGSHHHSRPSDDRDATLRHSRSHEPTPSQKEYTDYFEGYEDASRRNSAYDNASPVVSANGIGPTFGPSASPLFASHVAKHPQPQVRPPPSGPQFGPPRSNPSMRRAQQRPYSRSPDPSSRMHDDRDRDQRHHSSRDRDRDRHPRFEQSPPRSSYDDYPPPLSSDGGGGGRRMSAGQPGFPPLGPPPDQGYPPSGPRDRRGGRMSGSDVSGAEERERRGGGRPKHTRFAAGVDGRRYPDGTPWR